MSEFFTVQTPAAAREKLGSLFAPAVKREQIPTSEAVGRVLTESPVSPQDLPDFVRSTVDGFAVQAADTYGATPGLPAFLPLIGEVPMGTEASLSLEMGEAALVHTGGMIPDGADAVVMVENTQQVDQSSIEILKPVAEGENAIQVGEDIRAGTAILPAGHRLRPQDIGGLLALGIVTVEVAVPPTVAIISTGDEVVPPDQPTRPGQVRDINSYTLAALVERAGGRPLLMGIIADQLEALLAAARRAQQNADIVVISAGSSVSYRDMTSEVIVQLGAPGVLVHGLSVRPGKPTIVALCDGVPVIGLPGNPVSAMVIFDLVVMPLIEQFLGASTAAKTRVQARLARNIASVTGREDFVQVQLEERDGQTWAVPVFGKSNLIYTLVNADGVIHIPLDKGGLYEGEWVTVTLHE